MKKNKINKKACTNCGLEAAVARKVCSGCNTPFYSKRPTYFYETKESRQASSFIAENPSHVPSTSNTGNFQSPNTSEENCRRRTERVKREKPHFYDASEFQSQTKKKKSEKSNTKCTSKQTKTVTAQIKKVENKQLKKLKLRESLVELEEEQFYETIITPHKAEQLAIILQDLNNRLTISSWKP